MEQSILISTKKILGVGPEDDSFDLDIITHINSAFSILQRDLGVGPEVGSFSIEDETAVWGNFVADDSPYLSNIKTCVYLRARLLFDPPTSSYLLAAMQDNLREHEVRLSIARENVDWVDPRPVIVTPGMYDPWVEPDPSPSFDGGGA